jgi:hypothetical protein
MENLDLCTTCRAAAADWGVGVRQGLVIDPVTQEISIHVWQGELSPPDSVRHQRALMVDLPVDFRIGDFAALGCDPVFRGIVQEICALYQGSRFDGEDDVGVWLNDDLLLCAIDEVKTAIAIQAEMQEDGDDDRPSWAMQ